MKKLFIASILSLAAVAAFAQTKSTAAAPSTWAVDASHSNVKFGVTHMVVSEVEGYFKVFSGTIKATSDDFNDASIDFAVDVASINTDSDQRDGHLRSEEFFNATKYPKMTFKSSSFKKGSGNQYILEGDLTIRDITKHVKFNVTYGGTVKDPWGNTKAGFKARTTINRMDYGLKWNAALEAGGVAVSEDVEVIVNIELQKQ
jgi:polyisoprenoid-binding protein YceI